jgi:hypothetical protein
MMPKFTFSVYRFGLAFALESTNIRKTCIEPLSGEEET